MDMKFKILLTIMILSLAACGDVEEMLEEAQAEQDAADLARCERQGFVDGTTPMARCLSQISAERDAETRREIAQENADEAARKQREAQNRTAAASAAASAGTEGTFRGATGADPGAANLVLCSDGKLYEDCANSPAGF
jgi:hypothetical protein